MPDLAKIPQPTTNAQIALVAAAVSQGERTYINQRDVLEKADAYLAWLNRNS